MISGWISLLALEIRSPSFLICGTSSVLCGVQLPLCNLALRFRSYGLGPRVRWRRLRSLPASIVLKWLAPTGDGLSHHVTNSVALLPLLDPGLIDLP